jgi:hypothetical protein
MHEVVRLIKTRLNKTYSKVCIGKQLSHTFSIQNGLKHGEALSPFLFHFDLECAIRKAKENQDELKLNEPHQLQVYANVVNQSVDNINTLQKNTEAQIDCSMEGGLKVNT